MFKYPFHSMVLMIFAVYFCFNPAVDDTLMSCNKVKSQVVWSSADSALLHPNEKYFSNIRQLTFGGDNAEAYFSFDNKQLILQIANPAKGIECDQIYHAAIPQKADEVFNPKLISTGSGRTTCSYFLPDGKSVLYASTHKSNPKCPETVDWRKLGKYVWPLYPEYEIYFADMSGKIIKQVTENNFYDAEATVSPDGRKIVFTSTRDGDIDLYVMNVDGSNVKRITHQLGYDGGAFFSPDSKSIVFRSSRPTSPEEVAEYKDLLSKNLVAPTNMEIYVCDADGDNLRQITKLGGANWAPFFHPSGKKIIFTSNHHTKGRGFPFNLFMIDITGENLEQITFDPAFDSFPMFSPDGKRIVFSSNRNNGGTRDTNVFIADWVAPE